MSSFKSTLILVLGGVFAVAADQPPTPQNGKPAAPPAQAQGAPGVPGNGVKIFIDPATGKIIQPDDARMSTLSPSGTPSAAPRAVTQFLAPNGAVGVLLTPDSFSYAVATRTPDGNVQLDCVTGDLNAERAVIGPLSPAKEAVKTKASSDEKK